MSVLSKNMRASALLAAPLLLCACVADLEPAPLANIVPREGEDAAQAQVAGVFVTTLAVDRWPGSARLTDELTPMKVRIQNNSGTPLVVRYDRFSLRAEDGKVYRALPLFSMKGSVPASMTVSHPVAVRSSFVHRGFQVSPLYRGVYPGVALFGAPLASDPSYYSLYETYYGNKPLPTTEMQRRALPEGIVAHGGFVEGYLFFEEVPSSAGRVVFNYDLVTPLNRPLGVIRVPYLTH